MSETPAKCGRYLVIAFDRHYPSGGLNDVDSSYDHPEPAVTRAVELSSDHVSVWDRVEDVVIYIR